MSMKPKRFGGEYYSPKAPAPLVRARWSFWKVVFETEPKVVLDLFTTEALKVWAERPDSAIPAVAVEHVHAWQCRWNLPDQWARDFALSMLSFVAFVEAHHEDIEGLFEADDTAAIDIIFRGAIPPSDRRTLDMAMEVSGTLPLVEEGFLPAVDRWVVTEETRKDATARMRRSFEQQLQQYLDAVEMEAREAALLRTPEKHQHLHYEWLARWQVQGWSYGQVAMHYKVSEKTVKDAIPRTANEIGLTRRTMVAAEGPE